MFFKEARTKAKFNKVNKILEERGIIKDVDLYVTMMRTGKENEAQRIRKRAEKKIGEVIKEVGVSKEELSVIQGKLADGVWK